MKLEVPESFDDVAVDFSRDEWKMLSEQDKELHREVMVQNFEHMISVGYNVPLNHLLALIERTEKIPPDDTDGREKVLEGELLDGSVSICRSTDCCEWQREQISLGEHIKSERDEASPDFSFTRNDMLHIESRRASSVEYMEEFAQKTEPELNVKPQAWEQHFMIIFCNNSTFQKNNLQLKSKKTQNNTLATDEHIFTKEKPVSKPHKCSICDKTFARKSHLTRHQYVHSEQKPYQCASCNRGFRDKYSVKKHMLVHKGQKPYKCDICSERFTSQYYKEKHQVVHTGKKHNCATCGKDFRDQNSMERHQLCHTEQKCFTCDICKSGFKSQYYMEKHKLVHMEQTAYKCATCDKSFVDTYSLEKHRLVHKPYKCPTCDKGFMWKKNVKTHMITHMDGRQKPYKCTKCGKSFIDKYYMRQHQLIHTGQMYLQP